MVCHSEVIVFVLMPPPASNPLHAYTRRVAADRSAGGFKMWARLWLAPPALWEIARRFVGRYRGTNRGLSPPEHSATLSDVMFPRGEWEPHWVPVEKLVNGWGQAFTAEQHHFVRYLESGFEDFERFYKIHQPKTAAQARFISEDLRSPTKANVLDVPWEPVPLAEIDTPLVIPEIPESFGPASDLGIATEMFRLDKIRNSIEKHGFRTGHPRQSGGQITFRLFLHDNGDFRMVIMSGNHRTAVLVHLGWELIPAHQYAGYHPVRLSDLNHWPGVVDGRFTEEAARAMFEAFFRPRHQQLLPGW